MMFSREQLRLSRCSRRVDKHEAELRALTANRDFCLAEIATGYLELGSILARCAPDNQQGVLNIFKKSLEFDSKDLDVLELSARQAFAIGYDQSAYNYLSELAVAASEAKQQIRSARASRFQAEVLLRRGSQTALADARAKLVSNVAVLLPFDSGDPDRRNEELALTNERLAEVQIAREKFSAAGTALDQARTLFGSLHGSISFDGLERLKKLEDALVKAKQDRDNPDTPD